MRNAPVRRRLLVAVTLVSYGLAFGVPLLLPDGLDGLDEAYLGAAAAGIREARYAMLDNPLERIWVRQFRVVGVTPGGAPMAVGEMLAEGWEVRVKASSLFGLPYAAVHLEHGGGSVEYRLPTGPLALLYLLLLPVAVIAAWWRQT